MIFEYKLNVYKDAKPVEFKYVEVNFPIMDTEIAIYNAYKLSIMLSDGLAAVLNERSEVYNTFSGDLLFFSPDDLHHARILRQGVHKYIEILIPTEYFTSDRAYSRLFCDEKRTVLFSPHPKERQMIISVAERIIGKIKSPCGEDIRLMSELLELLNVCDAVYSKKDNTNIPATLQNAIDYIRKEYSENIQISDIATAVKCSSSYLSRIFKNHIGKSPYCYLVEYRLFVAEKLLRNGSTVTEAASMSGFCDSSVFIKCFKKAFGITPLKYKKKHEL